MAASDFVGFDAFGVAHNIQWDHPWRLDRGHGLRARGRRIADWMARKGLLGEMRRRRYWAEIRAMIAEERTRVQDEWFTENFHKLPPQHQHTFGPSGLDTPMCIHLD